MMMSRSAEGRVMLQEKQITGISGWVMVAVLVIVMAGAIVLMANMAEELPPLAIALVVLVMLADGMCWFGFTVVPPTTARVLLLFGDYKGSMKTPGFWWINPLTS